MDDKLFRAVLLPKPSRTLVFVPDAPAELLVPRDERAPGLDARSPRHEPPRTLLEGFVNRPDW